MEACSGSHAGGGSAMPGPGWTRARDGFVSAGGGRPRSLPAPDMATGAESGSSGRTGTMGGSSVAVGTGAVAGGQSGNPRRRPGAGEAIVGAGGGEVWGSGAGVGKSGGEAAGPPDDGCERGSGAGSDGGGDRGWGGRVAVREGSRAMSGARGTVTGVVLAGMLLTAAAQAQQAPASKAKPQAPRVTPPEAALTAYISRVRAQKETEEHTPGSIWSDQGRLVRLSNDAKAVRLHDVISIVVSESLAASTDGQVKNSRASSANSGLTALFGARSATSKLANLLGQSSSSGLTAQGQSVTNSSLATTFGGEVVDVLPNGMLVIQATRQLTFSQQTQVIKLRGLVRPEDVSAQNQVASTAMTDLELEVTGKGIVNDSTYRQNPIWRMLTKLLVF